jgi:sodium-dependent dicarboxylate transporter 2/3/5
MAFHSKVFDFLFRTRPVSRNMAIFWSTVLAAIGLYYILPSSMNELARRTVPIFFVAAIFWATEVMPLFATSLCIVAVLILSLAHEGGLAGLLPASSEFPTGPDGEAIRLSYKEFLIPFSSGIIILFMGGFLLSAAVTKHGIDRAVAARILRPLCRTPIMLIFGVLGITAFFSMWMSNTATSAMMLAIIAPIVRSLPKGDRFHRGVILAVPFGANIGGIGTPIGTPPNAVALGRLRDAGMSIGFIEWMMAVMPLMLSLLVVAGFLLYWFFPAEEDTQIPPIEQPRELGGMGRLTLWMLGLTILLWLTGKWTGISEAVVALLAAAALTALRVLDRNDVDSIDWNILLLMWGGLTLGHAIEVTQLDQFIVSLPIAELSGFWLILLIASVTIVLANFMSNTAAANLLIPMVMALTTVQSEQVGLAILVALSASFAMAMPVATPPNAMAFATGKIPASSLIRSGGLISLIAMVALLIGYQVMIPWLIQISGAAQ